MNGLGLPADERNRLATFVHSRRHALRDAIVSSQSTSGLSDSTVGGFAANLLGRLCQELRDGDTTAVDRLATLTGGGSEAMAFGRVALDAYSIVSKAFAADCERPGEIISYLALRSSDLEKRFRSTRVNDRKAADPAVLAGADEVVATLLAALEARDVISFDHSRAVGMWSGRLAKTMGLSEQQQAVAVLAGTLHDVGKIATPTELLLRPGPLSSDEWHVMRSHATIGARMLEKTATLRSFAPIVRAHHERFDGEGYPDRIRGEAIPLVARVVAVSDAFHAMISKRPYRQPISVPSAVRELRRGSGTQWDERVVEAMLSIVEPAGSTIVPLRYGTKVS